MRQLCACRGAARPRPRRRQVGCFVPAEFAALSPVDRLFTRIGMSDSIETNSSTFMVEMTVRARAQAACHRLRVRVGLGGLPCHVRPQQQAPDRRARQETAYIVRHATKRSLVIIDELGRATSTAGAPPASACPQSVCCAASAAGRKKPCSVPLLGVAVMGMRRCARAADGVAVAWAVCEHLLRLGAATLFATHFGQLAELAARHPTLRLWHFEAAAPGGDARARLAFTHRLLPGGQPGSHYGLALAAAVCVPDQILAEARRISAAVDAAARQHVRGGSSAHGADSAGGGADAGTSAGSGALQGAGPTQGGTASGGCEARRALCSLAHRVACVARAWADSPASVDLAAQLAPLQSEARTVLAAGERAAGGNGGGAGV